MSDAARNGIDILINNQPTILDVYRKPMVDGGMGEEVPYGRGKKVHTYKCRLSRDPGNLQKPQVAAIGLAILSDYYVVAPWFADIRKNDFLMESDGTTWRVGEVTKSKAFGVPFATKAPVELVK